MAKLVKVYEVFWNDGTGGGPAEDGSRVARFGSRSEAEDFAKDKIAGYGNGPATVRTDDVPRHLAERWGVA